MNELIIVITNGNPLTKDSFRENFSIPLDKCQFSGYTIHTKVEIKAAKKAAIDGVF